MKKIKKMKRIVIFNLCFFTLFGCSTTNNRLSNYQNKNIRKFSTEKKLRESVPTRKNGSYRHPAVTKETYKSF